MAVGVILLDASSSGQTPKGTIPENRDQSTAPTWESFRNEPRVAIVVGVNQYGPESGFTMLHQANNDARDVYKVLAENGYKGPDDKSEYPILNEAATKTRIKKEIEKALALLNGRGTLIFFFSGHGMEYNKVQYLAPYGVDIDDPAGSAIPVEDIQKKLSDSPVPRKVLFIDACREPSKDEQPQEKKSPPKPPPPLFSRYLSAKGILTLYASSPGKPSFEDEKIGHGIFSKFLIDGLSDKAKGLNGLITFKLLAEFVMKSVTGVRPDQQPTVSTENQSADFILGGTLQNVDLPTEFSDEELIEAGKKYYSAEFLSQAGPLQKAGKFTDARKKLDASLYLDPKNDDARRMRIDAATALRDHQTVVSDCADMVARLPKSEELKSDCASRLATLGQHASAVKWFSDALQLSPKNAAYLTKRAQSEEELRLYGKALDDWQAVRGTNNRWAEYIEDDLADTVTAGLATVGLFRGETEEADKLIPKELDRASRIYPRLALDWVHNDKPRALEDVLRAIWLRPKDEEVYFSACETRIWAGEVESGVLQCRIGADLATDEAYGLARLGIGQMLAGKKPEAVKTSQSLDQILKTQPVPLSKTLMSAAVLFNLTGSFARALEIAEQAGKLYPELPDAALHKAYALGKSGKNQEALEVANKLIAQVKEFGPAYRVRGQVRAALGDAQRAQTDEAEAKRLNCVLTSYY